MPDTDLEKLSDKEYEKAKQDFLKDQREGTRTARLARQAEFRSTAPASENLSQMTDAQFQLAKQRCLKNMGR